MKKQFIITLLLLAGLVSRGQTTDTITSKIDTVKILAEVEEPIPGTLRVWYNWNSKAVYYRIDSAGTILEVLEAKKRRVFAWQIRNGSRQKDRWGGFSDWAYVDVKLLSYNRKEELSHVLQTWRVEW